MKKVMKQPELGLRISQLRKSKGWTQEELVEKCNISVRTIQRIESGEVTPRSYTVRTILNALDFDLNEVTVEDSSASFLSGTGSWSLADLNEQKASSYANFLLMACIAGIVYFVVEFFDVYFEYMKYNEGEIGISTNAYLILKAIVLITYVMFMRGFLILGNVINNYLLKITSILQIVMIIGFVSFDLLTYFNEALRIEAFALGFSLTQGIVMILFGYSIYRSEAALGNIAKSLGILEIVTGICFVTIILSILGLLLLIPVEIIEIIILYKTMEALRGKSSLEM